MTRNPSLSHRISPGRSKKGLAGGGEERVWDGEPKRPDLLLPDFANHWSSLVGRGRLRLASGWRGEKRPLLAEKTSLLSSNFGSGL